MELKKARLSLEAEILKKLDAIRNKVLTSKSINDLKDVQLLAIVSDELDDVLLNWQISGSLSAVSFDRFDELDDLDLED